MIEKYRDTSIDPAKLDKELESQAANWLFVAELAAQAEIDLEQQKERVARLAADLDDLFRKKATEEGRKITEASLTKDIERDVGYRKEREVLLKKMRQRNMLKTLKEAWHMRKDLLIQRCIMERAEIESFGGQTVKTQAA